MIHGEALIHVISGEGVIERSFISDEIGLIKQALNIETKD